jgi:succinate dehydrogenase / fumarate reductase cytochrome b subunit
MSSLILTLNSSIGRKFIMAITGFGLTLFVMTHMLGNMLILAGPEAYNSYGHKLTSMAIYPLISWGLVACAAAHAYMGMLLTKQNRDARGGQGYAVTAVAAGKATDPASKSMIFSGSIILVFLIIHLANFKYGAIYPVNYGGVEMRDLHRLVIEKFQSPIYVVGYILALMALWVHLTHGVASIFQSLGVNHPKYNCMISIFGKAYSIIVAAGFISQPLYVFFFHRG